MRKPSGCGRVSLLLIPPLLLLFPIGTITFTLDQLSEDVTLDHTRNDASFAGISFNEAPTAAILGICVLVGFVSVIDVFGIWELRRIEGTMGHQRVWAWIILITSVATAGASAGVFGYASSTQNRESKAQLHGDMYADSFTRETWACHIKDLFPDESWARETCGLAKATRFLLIPMAVSSALVLISLWVLVRDRGGLRWLFGGKGRSAGLANTYELRPTSPGAPSTQPQPAEMPHSA